MSSLIRFNNSVSSLMDELLSTTFRHAQTEPTISPNVDITEDETSYFLYVDLPGLTKKEVRITAEDGVLIISGERKSVEASENEKHYSYFERSHGSFKRSFKIPENVDASTIKASMKHGVLEIGLKKDEKQLAREIDINIA